MVPQLEGKKRSHDWRLVETGKVGRTVCKPSVLRQVLIHITNSETLCRHLGFKREEFISFIYIRIPLALHHRALFHFYRKEGEFRQWWAPRRPRIRTIATGFLSVREQLVAWRNFSGGETSTLNGTNRQIWWNWDWRDPVSEPGNTQLHPGDWRTCLNRKPSPRTATNLILLAIVGLR